MLVYSKVIVLLYVPSSIKVPVIPHPCQHMILSDFFFFFFLHSDGYIVISCFICISLITTETEHSVWIFRFPFWLNTYLISFAHFSVELFVIFLLICKSFFLHILNSNPLSLTCVTNLFFQFVACPLTTVRVSFDGKKFPI